MATEPGNPQYQSLLSMITAAVAGKGVLYYATIGSILLLLSMSANTAFTGFPRLCRVIAEDGYLPRFFAIRGRRLVYHEGILVLAVLSAVILVAFGGVTDRLIPLFAIGAFSAFTLSQAGMVMHWKRERGRRWHLYLTINLIGAIATGTTVVVVLIAKFSEGAWITVLAVPAVILLMRAVKRHYGNVATATAIKHLDIAPAEPPVAVIPVSGWNKASQAALQFACSLTGDVTILHVECPDEVGEQTARGWEQQLNAAADKHGKPRPRVVSVSSPFRFITTPIVNYVMRLQGEYPQRKIALVLPDLIASHWYHYLLHNHRATAIRSMLLLRGVSNVAIINVPWYLPQ